MDRKKIITGVLSEFYTTNLASESAREWIADEIIKKLDNPDHQVSDLYSSEKKEKGVFEDYLSNNGLHNDIIERQKAFEAQEKNKMSQQKEVVEKRASKPVKQSKPKPKKQTKAKPPRKTLKNIRKPRGKFL